MSDMNNDEVLFGPDVKIRPRSVAGSKWMLNKILMSGKEG